MKRLFIAIATVAFATAVVGLLASPASAISPSAVVLPTKATLLADGSVQITMKVRCNDQQQAFEWSVDIRQGTIFGNDSAGPVAGLITCDGKFHTVDALVAGANGPYTAGPANVQALVQLFDADQGSDVELEDQAVVRLRP
jgi:hypothetical protein